jgi:tRNA-modifying protein YgfZ
MNQDWNNYLLSLNAQFDPEHRVTFPDPKLLNSAPLFPLTQFGIIAIAGSDATQFLQGQVTCDIKKINLNQSGIGAFCNPKGRVITTFFITQLNNTYFIILPLELLDKVKNKLKMYILRSDVQITDVTDIYCLSGLLLEQSKIIPNLPHVTWQSLSDTLTIFQIPSLEKKRFIVLAEAKQTLELWDKLLSNNECSPQNTSQWQLLDINNGIPWIDNETSEEYIPQMLNLDKLGGISFNKGCYTGQEVVARTHYLGKAKREMYLAETNCLELPPANTSILTSTNQSIGKVLNANLTDGTCKILAILPTDAIEVEKFYLNNANKPTIHLLQL